MLLSLRKVVCLNEGDRNVNLSTHTEICCTEMTSIICLLYSPAFYPLVTDILAYSAKPSCTNPGRQSTVATTRCSAAQYWPFLSIELSSLSPLWRLEFWGGFQQGGKFVHSCLWPILHETRHKINSDVQQLTHLSCSVPFRAFFYKFTAHTQ